ncbi:MAG: formylglycine-generating enzyme family protein [Planctomycetota bacterium]|nr:formylglycine-generating enzyme family protein [Planctomycetota bacterium]MDA1213410.1 formylglycine-generating enzyme family protein [Planctomycetota bacterium]
MGNADHDEVDGFRKWLGISSKKRPPTHYELLAVSLDEEDHEVIQFAAKQRKDFVKSKRGEGYDDHVTEILYLLAEAEMTLISPDLRRDYDQRMKLFQKRKKSRRLNAYGNEIPPYRASSAGVETGFVEEYGKLVAILCVAFFGMAAASFLLPWQKMFNSKSDPSHQMVEIGRGINNGPLVANRDDNAGPLNQAKASDLPAEEGSDALITNSIGMKLVLIPAGEFMMGSPDSFKDAEQRERPQHKVRFTKPFYMGQHEVTKGVFAHFVQETNYKTTAEQNGVGGNGYDAITGKFKAKKEFTWKNPGFEQTDDHPVLNVSWDDAVQFCEWLSEREKEEYQLPTEAQWEYVCRAGSQEPWSFGNDVEGLVVVGNVKDATAKEKFTEWDTIKSSDGYVFTAPVGQFQPNAFGIYDMHGNAWEWCRDIYDENAYKNRSETTDAPFVTTGTDKRLMRGGSWYDWINFTRSARRAGWSPDSSFVNVGFRVVRTQ